MAIEVILGLGLIIGDGELLVALDEGVDILAVDRAGVGHLDDHAVLGEHLLESRGLLQDLIQGSKGVVELHADVAARPQDAADLLHDLIAVLVLVAHVLLGIVDEEVVDDAGVAGQVADEILDGLDLIGVGGVGREDEGRGTLLAIPVIVDVALQVDHQLPVGAHAVDHLEACGSLPGRDRKVVDDLLEVLGHADVADGLAEEPELLKGDLVIQRPERIGLVAGDQLGLLIQKSLESKMDPVQVCRPLYVSIY